MLLFVSETCLVNPHMGKFFGGGLGLGGETSDRTAPVEENVQEVDIHPGSNGTGGGRVLDDGGIHQAAP